MIISVRILLAWLQLCNRTRFWIYNKKKQLRPFQEEPIVDAGELFTDDEIGDVGHSGTNWRAPIPNRPSLYNSQTPITPISPITPVVSFFCSKDELLVSARKRRIFVHEQCVQDTPLVSEDGLTKDDVTLSLLIFR